MTPPHLETFFFSELVAVYGGDTHGPVTYGGNVDTTDLARRECSGRHVCDDRSGVRGQLLGVGADGAGLYICALRAIPAAVGARSYARMRKKPSGVEY